MSSPLTQDQLDAELAAAGYFADERLATAIFLALGSASRCCSKARRASARPRPRRRWRRSLGRDLVRLQCYEGIDAAHALYEWNYRASCSPIRQAGEREIDIYDDRFLIERPLLQVLQRAGTSGAADR